MSEIKRGCGPDWAPRFIRESFFFDECVLHDIDYEERKRLIAWNRLRKILRVTYKLIAAAHKRRKSLDLKFLERMLLKANSPIRRAQAYFFYCLVRSFGWFFYTRS